MDLYLYEQPFSAHHHDHTMAEEIKGLSRAREKLESFWVSKPHQADISALERFLDNKPDYETPTNVLPVDELEERLLLIEKLEKFWEADFVRGVEKFQNENVNERRARWIYTSTNSLFPEPLVSGTTRTCGCLNFPNKLPEKGKMNSFWNRIVKDVEREQEV